MTTVLSAPWLCLLSEFLNHKEEVGDQAGSVSPYSLLRKEPLKV